MGLEKFVKHRKRFLWDFAAGAGSDSSAATGTIAICSVPANSFVFSVEAEVVTAVTGSTAEEVGDGTDPNGWLVDGFAASGGFYPSSAATAASAGVLAQAAGATDAGDVTREGKLYASADTIDYVITGTATAGKIWFVVEFAVMQ
jgi:hypothetical protein